MQEREIINLFYSYESSKKEPKIEFLDDCGLLPGSKNKIVSTDTLVENVHFNLDWFSPEDLAIKLFQVNLSDIVSSGGVAEWCLLTIGMSKEKANDPNFEKFLRRFASTFSRECFRNECHLIGGDTVRSNELFLGMTIGGDAQRYIKRSGGKDGDTLYVTGNLGLSLSGLRHLQGKCNLKGEAEGLALEKYLQPQARLEWAKEIWSRNEVHAMIDISDGLLNDAINLANASECVLNLQIDNLPLAPSLDGFMTKTESILSGEELELLFLGESGLQFNFPCTAIGNLKKVEAGESGVRLFVGEKDVPFPMGRFEHF